jgi:Fe-S cluster biogenesis protein NfuA
MIPSNQAELIVETSKFVSRNLVGFDLTVNNKIEKIADYLIADLPIIVELAVVDTDDADEEQSTDSPAVRAIKNLLKKEIKPMVALDGGDVSFVKYEKNILFVKMKGACSGCPSSKATLKQGIEVRMKEVIPEIIEVISI